MGTTADKLARLNETKALLKTRLTEKGLDVASENNFYNLADKVGEIKSGSTGKLEWIKLNAVQTLALPTTTQVVVDLPIVGNPIYVFVRIPTVGGGDYGIPYPILILTAYTNTLGVTPITNGGQVTAIKEWDKQIELETYTQTVSNNKVKIKVNELLLSDVEYAYIYG